MTRHPLFLVVAALVSMPGAAPVLAQDGLPILDVHLHADAADAQGPPPLGMCVPIQEFPAWDPAVPYGSIFMGMMKDPPCDDPVWSPETDEGVVAGTLEVMERRNVFGVLSGSPDRVGRWMEAGPGRFMPALRFNVAGTDVSPDSLRALVESGTVEVFGEITNQYAGIAPDDERMDPYWALAEELDLPVAIHVGTGPPGVRYLGAEGYRAALHSALTLEPVLVKYPRLRVYVMHAGWPMLDDMLALMYAHPQVYVDVGVISFTSPNFLEYLEGLVDAGFGKRIMFGSDQMVWPGVIERAIDRIEGADFLSAEQKRDIFDNNAARFLRLSQEEIDRHHGR